MTLENAKHSPVFIWARYGLLWCLLNVGILLNMVNCAMYVVSYLLVILMVYWSTICTCCYVMCNYVYLIVCPSQFVSHRSLMWDLSELDFSLLSFFLGLD